MLCNGHVFICITKKKRDEKRRDEEDKDEEQVYLRKQIQTWYTIAVMQLYPVFCTVIWVEGQYIRIGTKVYLD